MKTTIAILFALIGLCVGSAFAQNKATVMFDATGNVVAPSNFLSSNVLNRAGIIRAVNGASDLFGAAPLRSGEHVFVIDAGTFGNGGAAMFTHDPGSSNPTNTTDTITASPGRWIVRRVYSAPPALPLAAGSNSPLAGDLYLSAFVMNGVRYTNVTSSPGGSSTLSNAVLLGTTSFQDGIITNLTVINASLSNVSLTVPKLGTATAQSITTTNSFQLLALTASRGVLTDASKNLISDEAATGTGAPVRASNAVLVGKPEVPLQSTNEANTNTISSLGWVKRHVAEKIAEIPAGSGGFAVNGGGTHTNATNTSRITVAGSSGSASWDTVLPQTLIITNATNFTWTFPTGARLFKVKMLGAGGAGGSGRKGLTNTVCAGGAGGGAGAYSKGIVKIEELAGATTIVITNGAGGVGGVSQTTNSTHGLAGGNGGFSSFGNWIIASGGAGGGAGTAGAASGGSGGATFAVTIGGGGGGTSAAGAAGTQGTDLNGASYFQNMVSPSGGGGGGGIASTGVASVGARGGISAGWSVTARGGTGYGAAGAINGAGGAGSASAHNAFFTPGGGGGGGGSSVTGNGGAGGNGGKYGAGGGGGGAAGDGIGNSGAGGDGYDGVVIVVVE